MKFNLFKVIFQINLFFNYSYFVFLMGCKNLENLYFKFNSFSQKITTFMLIFLKTTTFHRFKMIAHFIKTCVYDKKTTTINLIISTTTISINNLENSFRHTILHTVFDLFLNLQVKISIKVIIFMKNDEILTGDFNGSYTLCLKKLDQFDHREQKKAKKQNINM
uniref:Transmembrane protein n=1 Tax=Heterorhabditis bacteriophora TaxID=37862 RepID=A0A1I7XB43_HETBA